MTVPLPGRHVVIALCGSEKKYRQSLDEVRRHLEERSSCDTESGGSSIIFSVVKMAYDAGTNTLSAETGEHSADVVLHKVSTLAPEAADALQRWCDEASGWRIQRGLPPVILLDPVEVTRVVLKRSLVIELLDGRLQQLSCSTPRSWLWSRGSTVMTPLCRPFSPLQNNRTRTRENVHEPRNVCSDSSERFWIVKTDLSSGPAFTHHMVSWKGNLPHASLPDDVQRLLPPQADVFVVQEFLACALPVLVKVYSIGMCVFLKAVSTASLMQSVLARNDSPVCIDSQAIFADEGGKLDEKLAGHWKRYLAEGGQIHANCTQIAAQLEEELKLTLFGFDLLLVPRHTSQHGDTTPLFDDVTGDPTPLLSTAAPVLIDLNYFPGFSGMENAGECLLKVIKSRVTKEMTFVETPK